MDNINQEKQFSAPQEQEHAHLEEQAEVLTNPENHSIPSEADQTQTAEQQIYPDTAAEPEVEIHQKIEHIAPLPQEEQLRQLKQIAREQSLEKAISIAKKLDNPWLEDKFHDDLRDDPELRSQLEAMGKLEKL